MWKMPSPDFYGPYVCLADGCTMPFLYWDTAMQHKECWHMALVIARRNWAKEHSSPSEAAQAAPSSELRWWSLRPVVRDVLLAVAWHPGLAVGRGGLR